ncbi:MAG: hypothetical protein BHW61_05325 [Sutterella sp. 63_29]|nr:MAG: hypothetical protein BHW61_05325 [Sutterella sp. 63_29]
MCGGKRREEDRDARLHGVEARERDDTPGDGGDRGQAADDGGRDEREVVPEGMPAPMQRSPIASESLPRCARKVVAVCGTVRPDALTRRPATVAMMSGLVSTLRSV